MLKIMYMPLFFLLFFYSNVWSTTNPMQTEIENFRNALKNPHDIETIVKIASSSLATNQSRDTILKALEECPREHQITVALNLCVTNSCLGTKECSVENVLIDKLLQSLIKKEPAFLSQLHGETGSKNDGETFYSSVIKKALESEEKTLNITFLISLMRNGQDLNAPITVVDSTEPFTKKTMPAIDYLLEKKNGTALYAILSVQPKLETSVIEKLAKNKDFSEKLLSHIFAINTIPSWLNLPPQQRAKQSTILFALLKKEQAREKEMVAEQQNQEMPSAQSPTSPSQQPLVIQPAFIKKQTHLLEEQTHLVKQAHKTIEQYKKTSSYVGPLAALSAGGMISSLVLAYRTHIQKNTLKTALHKARTLYERLYAKRIAQSADENNEIPLSSGSFENIDELQ